MKKIAILLAICVVMMSLSTVCFAWPSLQLTVAVDNGSLLNVSYTAAIIDPTSTEPVKIDFYVDDAGTPGFPVQYVGSSYTNNFGVAVIKFHLDRGRYLGGAIWVINPLTGEKLISNIVGFTV